MRRNKLKLGSRNRITGKDGVYTVEIDGKSATVQLANAGYTCSCGREKDCPHILLVRACGFAPPAGTKGDSRD